jgi:hypothetical protein
MCTSMCAGMHYLKHANDRFLLMLQAVSSAVRDAEDERSGAFTRRVEFQIRRCGIG